MKKIAVITLCSIAVVGVIYLAFAGKDNTETTNNPDKQDTSLGVSDFSGTIQDNKEGVFVDANSGEIVIDEDESSEKTNNSQNIANNKEKGENGTELEDKSKESDENTLNNDKTSQNDDEFYDTSDRDPFAEEQHKSDVPLVLVDKDGNEMEPATVYWDEESGRGTLDPSGYIPEGLPPGAVFVAEITPEEEARLREEFGVGD